MKRREALATLALASGCAVPAPVAAVSRPQRPVDSPGFSYCLNTSTIMGQKVGLAREIEIAAEAGFDGIEIWIRSIDAYVEEGGKLAELRKKIDDLGLQVENAIGFAQWIVDDDVVRAQALEQAKREMDLLAKLGCRRIAAPPAGATEAESLDLDLAGERFQALVEVGVNAGVIPQLEIWGFSKQLKSLAEVVHVAAAANHPATRILPDAYHLYKGESGFDGLKLLSPDVVEIFHINDYPGEPGPDLIEDKDRVMPGKGVAPLGQILTDLNRGSVATVISLELFNRDYWKEDPVKVAKEGIRSMQEAVAVAKKMNE